VCEALSATVAALALAVVLGSGNAYSGNEGARHNTMLVPSTNSEMRRRFCLCLHHVPRGDRASRTSAIDPLRMPAKPSQPLGWDVAQDEYIQVDRLVSDTGTAIIEGINKTQLPGEYVVSLGCSAEPVTATQMLKTRVLGGTETLKTARYRAAGVRAGRGPVHEWHGRAELPGPAAGRFLHVGMAYGPSVLRLQGALSVRLELKVHGGGRKRGHLHRIPVRGIAAIV